MSTIGGPNIIKDGLVMYLDAANTKSYPGTGNTWYDLSGNGNNTTINNGVFNSAGYFDSVGDAPSQLNFTTPNSTTLLNALSVVTGGWTIEEIIWIDDTTYPESAAGSKFGNNVGETGAIGFDWGHGTMVSSTLNVTVNDGTTIIRGDVPLNTSQSKYNKWIHRLFIYDRSNGQLKIYYDGVYQNTLNISTVTGSIYNGAGITWGTLYGWHHDGRRSLMRIYNKVLSPSEISQNFNTLKGRFNL